MTTMAHVGSRESAMLMVSTPGTSNVITSHTAMDAIQTIRKISVELIELIFLLLPAHGSNLRRAHRE